VMVRGAGPVSFDRILSGKRGVPWCGFSSARTRAGGRPMWYRCLGLRG
jgi:hypothetical protein